MDMDLLYGITQQFTWKPNITFKFGYNITVAVRECPVLLNKQ